MIGLANKLAGKHPAMRLSGVRAASHASIKKSESRAKSDSSLHRLDLPANMSSSKSLPFELPGFTLPLNYRPKVSLALCNPLLSFLTTRVL